MKQPYNTTIYNTALYMRLSRDDENYGDSVSIETQRTYYRVTPEGMAYYEEKCKEWEVTKEVIDKFIVRKG